MTPLLEVSPEDAKDAALRVNNSVKRAESLVKVFKAAYDEYVEKIKKYTTGNEEEMNLTIGECNGYLKEVVGQVHDVLSLHTIFELKLKVS